MKHTALVVLACLMALAGTAAADETTFCNAFITTLPYTIVTQGHYCFNKNLSTAITSGAAITINVDYVVLDLNNFKLGGGSAGLGTAAIGIFSGTHNNITIRNGNIRGFQYGILLDNGNNQLLENNVLDGNTQYGAYVNSDSTAVIRNNIVSNTGGSTLGDYAYGIYGWGDQVAHMRDNVVTNVFATAGETVGIYGNSTDHNLIRMGDTSGTKFGTKWSYNRDNTVLYATYGYAFAYSYALIGHNYNN